MLFGFYSGAFGNAAFSEPNGVYGFFEKEIGDQRKRLNWVYSIGAGLVFNFNYFDPLDNPGNELIGSGKISLLKFGINLIPITVSTEYNFSDTYTDIDKKRVRKFIPFNKLNILVL